MIVPAEKVFELMNAYGKEGKPFLFGIDFDVENGFFFDPELAAESGVLFSINGTGNSNLPAEKADKTQLRFIKKPVTLAEYTKAFELVHKNLIAGNSYLTNLTFPTEIELPLTLKEIFARSHARYRLLFGDRFVVFSPEIFVQIEKGKISSFPMKGTIDASLPGAELLILADRKETAEHNTIVDLIRNDLSIISTNVKVDRFRYIEKIVTHEKTLLQVSSEISGKLKENYRTNFGDVFRKLLPAGSISGAPKSKTLGIIHEAETYSRGFYTGVFGYFNGSQLDSGVMIRFIRKEDNRLVYCSGGGITANSDPVNEYSELIDKVYVPFI